MRQIDAVKDSKRSMASEIEQYVGNRSIEVKSDANPSATDLLQLRHEVQHREELRQVFLNESPVAWLDKISLLTGASLDAIQYLIDEYRSLTLRRARPF